MADSVLRFTQVTKRYGSVKAVDSMNLDVREGEIFSLLGPSGCGKTTTLRLIAGLEIPDDGEIYIGDRPIVSTRNGLFVPTHKRNLGMVFQSYALWPHMTVFDNVAYPLRARGIPGKETRDRVMQALDLVGLAELENRQAPQLSGGQQQRVAVARALVVEPRILLLDEPFSNLDARLREQMRVQLKLLLRKLGITAVMVTHDQVEALSMSNRIALMSAGGIEQLGSPYELYEQPASPFARDFLGRTVLFKGTVGNDESYDDRVTVCIDGLSGVVLTPVRTRVMNVDPGGRVFVAVRLEDVQVVPADNYRGEANFVPGIIDALLFIGDRYECRVRLGNDETVLLHTLRTAGLREGEPVGLRIREECISVWPR